MSRRQIHRIRLYWNASSQCERPAWACGPKWLTNNLPATAYPEHPWDFNLWADWDIVRRGRKECVVPFEWSTRSSDGPGIWDAFARRWEAIREGALRGVVLPGGLWGAPEEATDVDRLAAPGSLYPCQVRPLPRVVR